MSKKLILTFDIDGLRAFNNFEKLKKDDYIEKGTLKIIDFLKDNRINATFFLVGKNILDFPSIHKKLNNYDIGNHTYSHPQNISLMDNNQKKEEIMKCHKIIKNIYDKAPNKFRAPDYMIDFDIIKILKGNNYILDSSLLRVIYPIKYLKNYFKNKGIINDSIEFPPTSYILPFNGTSIINYGFSFSFKIFNHLLKKNKIFILNFHARDFVNKMINHPFYFRRKFASEISIKFLKFAYKSCEMISMQEYLN